MAKLASVVESSGLDTSASATEAQQLCGEVEVVVSTACRGCGLFHAVLIP